MLTLLGVCSLRARKTSDGETAAAKTIHIRIDSKPTGTTVVQASDGQVLGKTPWTTQRPVQNGTYKIRTQQRQESEAQAQGGTIKALQILE